MTANTPTEQRLQTLVAAKLKVDPAQVPLDQSFLHDLGLDSFDVMAIIVEIEQAFPSVSLSDDGAQGLKTLREVGEYIDRKIANPSDA